MPYIQKWVKTKFEEDDDVEIWYDIDKVNPDTAIAIGAIYKA